MPEESLAELHVDFVDGVSEFSGPLADFKKGVKRFPALFKRRRNEADVIEFHGDIRTGSIKTNWAAALGRDTTITRR